MDTVEESCRVLSISRQCSLLGISRSIRISLGTKRLDIRAGMVNGYHIYKDAFGQCVLNGNNRLVLKEGSQLAGVQHHGRTAVCQPPARDNR